MSKNLPALRRPAAATRGRPTQYQVPGVGFPLVPPGPNPIPNSRMQDVRDFTMAQKKSFGQVITTIAGATVTVDVKFPQAGGTLLGFGFASSNDPAVNTIPEGVVSVLVNNETVIDGIYANFLNVTNKDFEFFPYPRPLSATDVIKVKVTDTTARNAYFSVFYI